MTLTLTDLFCGAGGSSSGAETVPGVQVRMAANHWKLAVETHNTNLPHADHDCADISQTDPRRYPATDLLWASPECTSHSQAKGRKQTDSQPDLFDEVLPDEAAQRSRATMFDVCRFVEAMKLRGRPYKGFVVENVVDVRNWMFYDAWKLALRSAGYCLHFVYLNSMHAQAGGLPAPQSRDRWYCVGHLEKIRCPDLARWTSPLAYCPHCDATVRAVQAWKRVDRAPWGRYRQQYVWRCPTARCHEVLEPGVLPAAAAIDWSLRGERIGDRARPLAEKTIRRIEAGLRKYARPITLQTGGSDRHAASRTWPVDGPLSTQTCQPTKALACPPMVVPAGGTWNEDARSVEEPFRTRTTRDSEGLAVPPLMVPVEGRDGVAARSAEDPLATVTAAGNYHGLVNPPGMVMRNNGSRGDGGEHCTPLGEPLRTITTKGHQSLVTWQAVYSYDTGIVRNIGEPLPTQTTVQGDALLAPEITVDDCWFRMLEPHEIKAAMAFGSNYVLLGNKREQVRLAGNAVTPPAARDLVSALVEAITGEDLAA